MSLSPTHTHTRTWHDPTQLEQHASLPKSNVQRRCRSSRLGRGVREGISHKSTAAPTETSSYCFRHALHNRMSPEHRPTAATHDSRTETNHGCQRRPRSNPAAPHVPLRRMTRTQQGNSSCCGRRSVTMLAATGRDSRLASLQQLLLHPRAASQACCCCLTPALRPPPAAAAGRLPP